MARPSRTISVTGAREHNLREVDLVLPRDQLVVITGVSGSGKSSLAFDTIFAEGQRKYMESLSAYARQFLQQMQKPDVEAITGLPPTIAIQQRSGGHNPRSTVATTTEIWDYLRLLFARCGQATCWKPVRQGTCGQPISGSNPTQIVDHLMKLEEGTAIILCAPIIRGRKGYHRDVVESMQKAGFVRARVNGEIIDIRDALSQGGENPLNLGRYETHDIEAVVDRIKIKPSVRTRLMESIETTLRAGSGLATVLESAPESDDWATRRFSEHLACPDHPECSIGEMEPRLFSFNSPHGACNACDGLGTIMAFDERLLIPDPDIGVGAGAIVGWTKAGRRLNAWYSRQIRKFCEKMKVERTTPVARLTARQKSVLLEGSTTAEGFRFEGVIPNLQRRYLETSSDRVREFLASFQRSMSCTSCSGFRLRPEALHVKLNSDGKDVSIADVAGMTIESASDCMKQLQLTPEQATIADPILKEIQARLGFLISVGLDYLTLDRSSTTLSGGEAQRIRLATQVGSGLVGVCYVLDEPTIGLHQRDNDRLITTLQQLSEIGNTVLVVEHDEGMIRAADHVVDVGPGPGIHGGTIVAQGSITDLSKCKNSVPGAYLTGKRSIQTPEERRPLSAKRSITIKGATEHNLRNIDVSVPLGGIICVTGVSGSGKSTLINEVLSKAARNHLTGGGESPGAHKRINGLGQLDKIIQVDQAPIGRTPRSNPATYTSIFDGIRKLFTQTREAKIRGYQPGRFSFNVKGGRCESCQGQGVRRIEMHFLPDVFVTCEDCHGTRYNPETLEVTWRNMSIADVLHMTIEDATPFFEAHASIHRMLTCLNDVGLGYLRLGQPSTTLSGGEAQRVKLARELGTRTSGRTLYILDEPTTGLHFADVDRLISVLHRLADRGDSLVVIEHNMDVIRNADWIIDLGPEGGARGGTIVAEGTPETVAGCKGSHTGHFLKSELPRTRARTSKRKVAAV
ncbi:MAG: excinuclease ABC subunit UvrA [Phycisphaerales bacterium]|nr:excinuclease ABC subunit UvrA [Phycisphaerales bacterium]